MTTRFCLAAMVFLAGAIGSANTWPSDSAAGRLSRDAATGGPLVAHVFVALCDNEYQGIVPVPRTLGNGQDPASNLYWGARFGLRTYLTRDAGWTRTVVDGATPAGVLERLVLRSTVTRADRVIPVVLLADAWDGRRIRDTIRAYLEAAAGWREDRLRAGSAEIAAGGASHLVVFVGHNGLMDFSAPEFPAGKRGRAAAVLACASRPYFEPLLRKAGAEPVVLTTGLMAPEAYTVDAVVRSWFETGDIDATRAAAARAYDRFQKCGPRAARRLFDAETSLRPRK